MSDEYAKVARGKLKLKTDSHISKKKKKKRDKEREREQFANVDNSTIEVVQEASSSQRKLTKAEESFKKMQEKMVSSRNVFSNFIRILNSHKFIVNSKPKGSMKKPAQPINSKWRSSTRNSTI